LRPGAIAAAAVLPLLQGALITAPYWLPWLQETRCVGGLQFFPAGTTSPLLLALGTIVGCALLEGTLHEAGGNALTVTWEWRCARLSALIMVALALTTAPVLKARYDGWLQGARPVSPVAIAPVTEPTGAYTGLSAVLKRPAAVHENAPLSILGLSAGKADVTCQWQGMSRFTCHAFAITATSLENHMREHPGWAWAVDGKVVKERKTKVPPGAHEITWSLRQTPLRLISFAVCVLGLLWAAAENLPFARRWRHGAIR
jgi:hypothetical protein